MTSISENLTCLPTDTDPSGKAHVALIAGEGELPVKVAKTAMAQGLDLFIYTMDKGNLAALKRCVAPERVLFFRPGLLNQNFRQLHQDGIRHAVFAGKINKWILLRSPVLDSRAISMIKRQKQFNDDSVMLTLIREFEGEGISILRQTDFLQSLFLSAGVYTHRHPTQEEYLDIEYGMSLAKEMGRLDVGQTVVVTNRMVVAVETIEGTDQAILRTRKWTGKKGGIVAKVEKPGQDLRFDVPTVGPRTLKTMKKSGLKVLAIEAHKTLVLQREELIRLADKWDMTLIAL